MKTTRIIQKEYLQSIWTSQLIKMPTIKFKLALIIPTLNAEKNNWFEVLQSINQQTIQPDYKIILDSNSSDNTIDVARKFDFDTHVIDPDTYDHAGTRKWGISLIQDKADIVIFMTQDAILDTNNSFDKLIKSFTDEAVAIAYGRQLPRDNASPIETFGRIFNYTKESDTRELDDRKKLGMKVAFCSDSYSAYRLKPIIQEDAFPKRSIVGEDYITATRMLIAGYKIRYEALATVKHSHDYTIIQEFKRYFDIGVFHQEYSCLLKYLGSTEKAGASYVKSEIIYLLKNNPSHLPLSIVRTISKYLGYKAGTQHKKLSKNIKIKLSMHKFYFV